MRTVPIEVERLLKSAISRVRRLSLVRGLAFTGVVWLVAVAAVMAVDSRLVIFDDRVRWLMSAAVWLLTLAAAAFSIVIPLCRRMDRRRIARIIDARHPELEERFSTLVELSESDASKAGFSAGLFALVGDLAERDAAGFDVRREFPAKKALRRLAAFAALLLALFAGIVASPNLVGRLFVRTLAPWADVGNLYGNDIRVTPGDIVILAGDVLRIEAEADESLHASPSIRISRRTGLGWSAETFEPMPNGVYEMTADANEREWRYRVNAGPAVTRYYRVRVSERPKYDSFVARVVHPAYTGFGTAVFSNADVSAIRAIEGTRVTFDLKVSERGTVADFRIGGEHVTEHLMKSNLTANWSLELVNRDGFRSSMGCHPLTSWQDQPPTLVIEKPSGRLPRLPPHAKIPVEITASDDVRVLTPMIRYSVDGSEMKPFHEVDQFVSAGGNLWRGQADLDLSTLDLVDARQVCFDLVTGDNRADEFGGPHVITSSVITVDLEYRQWGLEVLDLQDQVRKSNALIDEAKKRMSDAARIASELRRDLDRRDRSSESLERRNETAAHEAEEARKRLEGLRDRLEEDERFRELARPLEKTLDEKLLPALAKIENAPFQERSTRADDVEKAAEELKAAREEMEDLARRLKERAEKVATLEKTKDIAARQEALAKSAEELLTERPLDTARLEAWKRLEEDVMRRTDELARERPPTSEVSEARRKMETAARAIDELKRELERQNAEQRAAGEAEKRREAEKKAADERTAENLRGAADEQKKAEEAQGKGDHMAAAQAQRNAEARLDRAEALPGAKELQRQATRAEQQAAADPKSAEKAKAASEAQKAASEAVRKEQEVREAIAQGKKTEKDLAKLDADLRKKAAAAARQPAAEELKKAVEAQKKAEEAQGKGDHKAASEAQENAEEALKRADALAGARELQRQATRAEQQAAADPKSAEKAKAASEAQKAASEAAKKEQEVREAIAQGKKTGKDLARLDDDLCKEAMRNADGNRKAELQQKAQAAEARENAFKAASEAQKKAEEATKAAAENRAAEQAARAEGKAEEARQRSEAAKKAEQQAAEAQKAAQDALDRAKATEGAKAMQKAASEAQKNAGENPHSPERAAQAAEAQKAASEAVKREKEVRDAMESGEKTQADLEALDREFRAEAAKTNEENRKAMADDQARERVRNSEAARQEKNLRDAANEQRRAEQGVQSAQARRDEERKLRDENNRAAADQKAREAAKIERNTQEALKRAADLLERGEAMDSVKALQRQAAEAAKIAQNDPESAKKMQKAVEAQKAAEEALKKELEVREAMRKGEKTEDDLKVLDKTLKDQLLAEAEKRTCQARENAERALKKAQDAIGEKPQDEVDSLANAALDAKRESVAAELAEAELRNDDERVRELNDMGDDLDMLQAENAEAKALEDRILSLQKAAAEAMERGDRNQTRNLQGEIASAQTRAAENTNDAEDAEEARKKANEAQAEAQKAEQAAERAWNAETRDEAVKAQNKAMEAERAAQAEARAARTLEKVAAARKDDMPSSEENGKPEANPDARQQQQGEGDENSEQNQANKADQANKSVSKAANAAADAMKRETNAQAAALGMKRKKNDDQQKDAEKNAQKAGGQEKGTNDEKNKSGGGNVSDEISKLAKDLGRHDGPGFLKSLFSRAGWFKIRGAAKDGAGAYDPKDVPPEYRDLVRRYFLKLSEENP